MENYIPNWPRKDSSFDLPSFRGIDLNVLIKESHLFDIYNSISWKKRFISDMRLIDNTFGLRDILYERISSEARRRNYDLWEKIPKKIAETFFGIKFSSGTHSGSLRAVVLNGMYFSYDDFIPNPGDVVVDAGAQYGDYSLMCSKVFGAKRVVAFEPLPEIYESFVDSIRINEIGNVKAMNVAVSSENKEGIIMAGDTMAGISGDRVVPARFVRLDDTVKEKVEILKIDVEGFEMQALNGAEEIISKYHPKIIIEVHSSKLKSDVIAFLRNFEYKVIHRGRKGYANKNGMDLLQNLYLY